MNLTSEISRREFLQNLAVGAGGFAVFSSFGFIFPFQPEGGVIKAIVVDFDKCTGCRTCEAVCSAYNHKVKINGELLNGLGNPELSNIKVWHYNPDVDVPVTCFLCKETPCIEACPVEPDPVTGRKALYRDETFHTIQNDPERCVGCGLCVKACKEKSGGVIFQNSETGKPNRICNLCNGNPQCVKYCPYGALQYIEVTTDMPLRNTSPDKIAEFLIDKYYKN